MPPGGAALVPAKHAQRGATAAAALMQEAALVQQRFAELDELWEAAMRRCAREGREGHYVLPPARAAPASSQRAPQGLGRGWQPGCP